MDVYNRTLHSKIKILQGTKIDYRKINKKLNNRLLYLMWFHH